MDEFRQYEDARNRIRRERLDRVPEVVKVAANSDPVLYRNLTAYAEGRCGYLEAMEDAAVSLSQRYTDAISKLVSQERLRPIVIQQQKEGHPHGD